jgi:hypothetical protein
MLFVVWIRLRHFKRIREEQLAKKRAQEEALGIAVFFSDQSE